MTALSEGARILVVRLGAMGDIIHTLPAVASLKHSFPGSHLTWAVERKWAALLEGNVFVDSRIVLDRDSLRGLMRGRAELRRQPFDFAVDFQGLIKSALVASAARPDRIFGFARSQVRERPAALFYSNTVASPRVHVIDRNLDLARGAGAVSMLSTFPLPAGKREGELPGGEFVLASPLAGWQAKQWPPEHYAQLAARLEHELGVPLVINGPPASAAVLSEFGGGCRHLSGVEGLIWATRRAAAVLGVDSGPLHVAAALARPGVALFGPTDPARNGPWGNTFTVLRDRAAVTSYKRGRAIDPSMRALTVDMVFEALKQELQRKPSATRLA